MFCSKCNAQLSDEAIYCPYCGTKVKADATADNTNSFFNNSDVEGDNRRSDDYTSIGSNYVTDYGNYGDYKTEDSPSAQPDMPMKWYKFLIYFSLFAGAVISFLTAMAYFTGAMYIAEDGTIISDIVYMVFPSLKTVDVIFASYYLVMTVLMVFTRFQLSSFKRRGPRLVIFLYIAEAVSYVLYLVMVLFALEGNGLVDPSSIVDGASMGSTIATSIVMAIINHVYFKKRAHLFVN